MSRVLFLADGSSIHTKRWVNSLLEKGVTIHLFSLKPVNAADYPDHDFTFTHFNLQKRFGGLSKLSYLKVLPELKKVIRDFKPDILHAHFATSYGLLGALSGFHPFILSVWGSDVFDFPKKSFLHKSILEYNLKKADRILSTSHVMAEETKIYTDKEWEEIFIPHINKILEYNNNFIRWYPGFLIKNKWDGKESIVISDYALKYGGRNYTSLEVCDLDEFGNIVKNWSWANYIDYVLIDSTHTIENLKKYTAYLDNL